MKHPHAELMMQYAQDAMETDKPWERWQFLDGFDGQWKDGESGVSPAWFLHIQYRRKPNPYEPTLLDQALELEIEAALKKMEYYGAISHFGSEAYELSENRKRLRSPAMIEHLKSQGKL